MTGKYIPFEIYLADVPGSTYEITFTFEDIEKILASKLPTSAYEDRRWWDHETEANHVNKRAWANAGWKIVSLDINEKWVKFIRA